MSSTHIGLICLFLFAASQGVRDAYFGNVFQSVSFFLVATIAFALSSVTFAALSLVRQPNDIRRLISRPRTLILLNITTAAAWLSFFLGLRYLEPAVVAMLFNGIGPLAVFLLVAVGAAQMPARLSWIETAFYVGLAATLTAMSIVVLSDNSGMPSLDRVMQALALAMVIVGGVSITVSYRYAQVLTDAGIGSDAVMAGRFALTFAIAFAVEAASGLRGFNDPNVDFVFLSVAAFALIVIPSFLVQFGVSRTTPLAANILRTLGPVFVFAVQQLDGRLNFSSATLACIAAFCLFTIGASLIRGRKEVQAAFG